jgi:dTDP-4-dehydrorhamnose reductase
MENGARTLIEPNLGGQRVLVTGAGGQLGSYLLPALARTGAIPVGLGSRPGAGIDVVVDVADRAAVQVAVAAAGPDAIVHAAAWTDVDGCERDPERAEAINAGGSRHIAEAADGAGAYLIMVSTDFVFPGDGDAPYVEDAPPRPLSVYGGSKRAGEEAVLATCAGGAIARTAWLYGGSGKHFPRTVLTVLRDRGAIEVVADEAGSPTFAGDLAAALVALLAVQGAGIFHLANAGRATRFDLARTVAAAAGLDPSAVAPTTTAAYLAKYPLPARRPMDSTLANTRAAAIGIALRPWEAAVAAHVPRLAAEVGLVPGGEPALDADITRGGPIA